MSDAVKQMLDTIDSAGGVISPHLLEQRLIEVGLSPRQINQAIQFAYEAGYLVIDPKARVKRTLAAAA